MPKGDNNNNNNNTKINGNCVALTKTRENSVWKEKNKQEND